MNRGDVYDVELPSGRRPAVIVTRDTVIPLLSTVCVAEVTSRVRGLITEVPVGPPHGLARESVVNCDNLFTVRKRRLGARRGSLEPADVRKLDDALRIALGLE